MTNFLCHSKRIVSLALLGFCCYFLAPDVKAQDLTDMDTTSVLYDSLLNDYLLFDSLLLNELTADSSSFLQLLEDLASEKYVKSSFNIRAGYSGQVANAGRTIGIDQYGFSAGVSYYHKSGIFADVTGLWNSEQIPNYYTVIAGLGYMGNFTKNWSYWAGYEHYFYSTSDNDSSIPLPFDNALNASTTYYLKKFSLGADYSFTFGEETAHRVRANLGYNLAFNDVGFFDRISINPNISMLMGNANVITWTLDINRTKDLISQIGWRRFRFLKENYPELLASYLASPVDENVFGIMNYSLFVPVSVTIKKMTLMVNYTLNLPVALPGETLDTSLNNYVSATIMYTF